MPEADAWLQARARLAPGLLSASPPWVRARFATAWAARRALAGQLALLPARLWGHLLGCSGGYLAVVAGPSRYLPGTAAWRDRPVDNLAEVSVEDLALGNERPLHVVGHLVDHCLGCGGRAEGDWLSHGGGLTPAWHEAGARLAGLFALGHGADEVARSGLHNYFAQSLALYCRDRRRLNAADPLVEKWLRTTLWSDAFWQGQEQTQWT